MKKIVFIIYSAIIAATLLCALFLKQYLNVVIDSLVPTLAFGYMLCVGCLLHGGSAYMSGGRFYMNYRRGLGNAKYYKDDRGKGSFDVDESSIARDRGERKTSLIVGYLYLIMAALTMPLIFFFSLYVKWWASLGIFLGVYILSVVINAAVDITEARIVLKERRRKNEALQKELEEQKKREELGRWK